MAIRRRTTAGAGRGGRALSAWTILHAIENIKQTHFHLLSVNSFHKCGRLVGDLKIDQDLCPAFSRGGDIGPRSNENFFCSDHLLDDYWDFGTKRSRHCAAEN